MFENNQTSLFYLGRGPPPYHNSCHHFLAMSGMFPSLYIIYHLEFLFAVMTVQGW